MQLHLAAAAMFGCAQPPAPVLPVLDLELPITMRVGAARHDGSVSFTAPEDVSAADLRFDGWWSDVSADLDRQPIGLGAISPGVAPLSVEIGGLLSPGPHTLAVRVGPPVNQPRRLSLANRMFRLRDGALRLHTRRPEAHIRAIALPWSDGRVSAVVEAVAPDTATVELFVSLDGRRLLAWDPEPNVGGIVRPSGLRATSFAPKRWTGDLWSTGLPALYIATAVIRATDGTVLDARSERVGFRSTGLVDGQLRLNGKAAPLMAMRLDPADDVHGTAEGLAEVGANAVEIHGLVAGGPWLSQFDEWGLPVVYMPRCDGSAEPGLADDPTLQALASQDANLVRFAASHPAVLAWVCEGSEQNRPTYCGDLHEDPLERPVLGLDGNAASIAGTETGTGERTWVIELGAGGTFISFDSTVAAFLAVTGAGGPGGVILPPPPIGHDPWAAAWRTAGQSLGVTAWRMTTRRAASAVVVTGLEPGAVAVIEAPWMTPLGSVADQTGTARIDIWYEGAATLRIGDRRLPVTLTADSWNGVDRVSHPLVIDGR